MKRNQVAFVGTPVLTVASYTLPYSHYSGRTFWGEDPWHC
jgi:hypothetical protein